MPTNDMQHEAVQYHTPKITCPRCGTIMRLARVEQVPKQEARLIFDCNCGFEYRMSERARTEAYE
jgi:RNase P subunit RPR2